MSRAWMERAACQDSDTAVFFASGHLAALAICSGCPVKAECLEYALAFDEEGIWGGMTQADRNKLRRSRRRKRLPMKVGADGIPLLP